MTIRSEDEWRTFIDDGDRYLKAAAGGAARRPEVFTPEILYNLSAMAIEKHAMGYLMVHRRMPENHTLRDLMDAIRKLGDLGIDARIRTHAGPPVPCRESSFFYRNIDGVLSVKMIGLLMTEIGLIPRKHCEAPIVRGRA
jgi:hypothetical protein